MLSGDLADTARLRLLTEIASYYSMNNSDSQSTVFIEQAYQLAEQKNLKIPYTLRWIKADVMFRQQVFDLSLKEMNIVAEELSGADQLPERLRADNFRGRICLWLGLFEMSIELLEKNISIAKEKNIPSILPDAYRTLSAVYRNLERPDDENKTLHALVDASGSENDKRSLAIAFFLLGDFGMRRDSNFITAIHYYRSGLGLYKELNDTASITSTWLRIGWNYYLKTDLDSALISFNNSLNYSLPSRQWGLAANAYGNMGTIYRDKNEFDKAVFNYQKSIDYALRIQDWHNLTWIYKDISEMYKQQEDYKNAYAYFVRHKQYSDSTNQQGFQIGLANARTRFASERKEKNLELLSLELRQREFIAYGLAGMLVMMLIIGLLIFTQFRANSKRRIAEMSRQLIEMTQLNLRQQMNPHFIFNTLNSIQYYMYQHDKISTNNYLTKFSSLMRKILENSQHTSIPIKDELDAIRLYLELETLRFKEKFDYEIHVDEDIDTLLYKIPTMLIQPYVENAIGHGLIHKEGNGFLKIDFLHHDHHITCRIEDNGIGREAAMEIKKNKNSSHNSLGTRIAASRLDLVNNLYSKTMKIQYTDLKDDSGKPLGTRVEIQIPVLT